MKPLAHRRSWLQRLLLLAGLAVAAGCFLSARVVWDAEQVLTGLGRIRVPADVLASKGAPGDPVTFLVVGVDSSEGLDENDPVRAGRDVESEANGRYLPDTILIARLDPATGSIDLLSIPRDLYVEVPGSSAWKINSSLVIGGMGKLIETIEANVGIEVNHFVVVNFAGFSDLVDLIDGVPVYFPYPTRDIPSGLSIEQPGCWILDGSESLSYVRARSLEEQIDDEWVPLQAAAPDLARIDRQQQFMVLALQQALSLGGSDFGRVRSFVDAGAEAVQLDESLTPGELIDLAQAFQEFDTEELETQTLPVRALFGEDGRYLGEQLQVVEAEAVLAPFVSPDESERPSSVFVSIRGPERDRARVAESLTERGFSAEAAESADDSTALNKPAELGNTVLSFGGADVDQARLLARYLEVAPTLVLLEDEEIGQGLHLSLGADFAGVRTFPRPNRELDRAFGQVGNVGGRTVGEPDQSDGERDAVDALGDQVDVVDGSTTSTIAPGAENEGPSSEPNDQVDGDQNGLGDVENPTSDVSNTSTIAPIVSTTVIRGRAPEGTSCQPHGTEMTE